MPLAIYVDQSKRKLVAAQNSKSALPVPTFIRGDKHAVELIFVIDGVIQVPPTAVKLGFGRINSIVALTQVFTTAENKLSGVLDLDTAEAAALIGTNARVYDTYIEIEYCVGAETVTVRSPANFENDMIKAAPSVPSPALTFATKSDLEAAVQTLEEAIEAIPAPVDLTPLNEAVADLAETVANLPAPTDIAPLTQRVSAAETALASKANATDIPAPTDLTPLTNRVTAAEEALAEKANVADIPAPLNLTPLTDRVTAVEEAVTNLSTGGTPTPAQVDVIDNTGEWTKPAGARYIKITPFAGGGGGGGGGKGATGTTRTGGYGGGAGGCQTRFYQADQIPAALDIVIGAGGNGGSGATVDSTSGTIGINGGDTYVTKDGNTYAFAFGGGGGSGGGASPISSGLGGQSETGIASSGLFVPSGTGITGTLYRPLSGGAGGGAGGGISSGNVTRAPTAGISMAPEAGFTVALGGLGAGIAGTVGTPNGGNGTTPVGSNAGGGGGGGYSNPSGAGGNGGNGGVASGGGGGGSVLNAVGNAGNGGNGGKGRVVITTFFA
jgi:hypothetical protein